MMHPMRAALLIAAVALAGCSGLPFMGVRQDKEDQAHAERVLERVATGQRFAARELIEPGWTRLWVFPGGTTTQAVEDRIGIPFPKADVAVPAEAYLVFDDGKQVVSAFSYAGPVGATGRCLLTRGAPLGPDAPLVEVRPGDGGPTELRSVTTASRC